MNRRGLLKAIFAVGAIALPSGAVVKSLLDLKPEWLAEFERTGIMRNETIYLEAPLVIDKRFAHSAIRVEYCKFIAVRKIPFLVRIERGYIAFIGCEFDCREAEAADKCV